MIKKVTVKGLNKENSYFYIDSKTSHGFIIDPGYEGEKLLEIIKENEWIIEAILITHGHFDHIGAIEYLRKNLNCEVYAGENAKIYFENPEYNLSYMTGKEIVLNGYEPLKEGEKVALKDNSNFYLEVMETPGHTKDGVVYFNKEEKIAFVGDTIFKGTYGRTDLPGSSEEEIEESIKKILSLDKETILYPGHSDETTVKEEIENYVNLGHNILR